MCKCEKREGKLFVIKGGFFQVSIGVKVWAVKRAPKKLAKGKGFKWDENIFRHD